MQQVINNYEINYELGRGNFGVTYLGYDRNKQQQVAIKTLDIQKSKELGVDMSGINDEINTFKTLSSFPDCYKYVACYYDSFEEIFNEKPTIFIISEYIDGGSLTDYIEMYNGSFTSKDLWALFSQLILGLNYIHTKGFAHRDIKPDNILITQDGTVKYIDFGLSCYTSCKIDEECINTCDKAVGTLVYMSPEYIANTQENSLKGTQANDIWSLAIVFYNLANGINKFPFALNDDDGEELDDEEVKDNIEGAPYYESEHPDSAINTFIDRLLVNDWYQRPTIFDLMKLFK